MPNINASRYQRWWVQPQTVLTSFNNSSGTWISNSSQLIRVDANSATATRDAPYSRFPVLTGTRTEVAGIRGRKRATWSIRGLPFIPSGAAGSVPDVDIILRNIFGQASTIVASTSATYSFLDTGYLPFSLFEWNQADSSPTNLTFTQRALWGCFVTRVTWNFNGLFLTMDLDGFAGYSVDSTGFSSFPADGAVGGLTAFPAQPSGGAFTAGQPIAGFGNGFSLSFNISSTNYTYPLSVRALSLTLETGATPVDDLYDSPYLGQVIGGTRRVSIAVGDILDSDLAALNTLKSESDTDIPGTLSGNGCTATIVAGNTAGSIFTWNLNQVQFNSFDLRDNGAAISFVLPQSFAHATQAGLTNDMTLVAT